jgi:IS30 family transposase
MSCKNDNTKKGKKQYKYLSLEERVKIETLVELKDENGKRIYKNAEIARKIGKDRATIGRELKNRIVGKLNVMSGKTKNLPYTASLAQDNYKLKRGMSRPDYILNKHPKMKKYIEEKIKQDGWSPDAIVGHMEKNKMYLEEGFTSISTATIYRGIHYGILKVKKEETRRMAKFKTKEKYLTSKKPVAQNKRENSIERRGAEINERKEFGHWELDTVLGKAGKGEACLLTLTERLTRQEIIYKLNSKKAEEVTKFFAKLKRVNKGKYKEIFKTITTDNGTEFSEYKKIIKNTGTQIYFCHPYASCEKGTNEKHNGIIRYFIEKGTSINKYTQEEINKITKWMNEYPRKILGYSTPKECFEKEVGFKIIIPK